MQSHTQDRVWLHGIGRTRGSVLPQRLARPPCCDSALEVRRQELSPAPCGQDCQRRPRRSPCPWRLRHPPL